MSTPRERAIEALVTCGLDLTIDGKLGFGNDSPDAREFIGLIVDLVLAAVDESNNNPR